MPLDLASQEVFESLWFHKDPALPALPGTRSSDRTWIVYFGASWCGPCKRLDIATLNDVVKKTGIPLWKCDVDENDYTPGYCQVRSIPTFICFSPGKEISRLQSSNTQEVAQWMYTLM